MAHIRRCSADGIPATVVQKGEAKGGTLLLKLNQLDRGGSYHTAIQALTVDEPYIISNASTTSGCLVTCDATIASGSNCVNLSSLVSGGWLGQIPVSPNGDQSWTSVLTGYYLTRNANGSVTVGACESENVTAINITQ